MKHAFSNRKISILVLLICLFTVVFTVAVAATETEEGWTFTEKNITNPFYVNEPITEAPQAYEVVINVPEKTSVGSPIISNYYNGSMSYFGLSIGKDGIVNMMERGPVIKNDGTVSQDETTQVQIPGHSVIGRGWVKLAVIRDTVIDEENGIYKAVYRLYENGKLMVTFDATATSDADKRWGYIPQMDVVDSQAKRKLSIGSHGTAHFKGQIKSIAVYSAPLTEDQVIASYENGVDRENSSLLAYYDYGMSGNTSDFIKDQTGNGHDATYSRVFYEREEAVKDYAYSFAFIGDTQKLVLKDVTDGTSYSSYIYDWIVKNKDKKNIQHVFGLGDITDVNYDSEWQLAVELHKKLENADIPYGIIPGNHDDLVSFTKYNAYFGAVPYFTDRIDEYYVDGRVENYAMKFEVGSHKYMLVGLQYLPTDDVLAWANDVIAANPDRRTIVTTHWFLNSDGTWSDDTTGSTNRGKQIWDKLLSRHSNVIMAVGGHVVVNDIQHRTDVGVNGNTVHTFLIDPQGLDPAEAYQTGMVAMFYFSEDGSEVQVEYVSTYRTLEAQKTNTESQDILYKECNQFSFTLPDALAIARYTDYGPLPESCDTSVYKFALFSEGRFINCFKTWGEAVAGADAEYAKDASRELQILLLSDYDNTEFIPETNAFNSANGLLTVDLNHYRLTVSDALLDLTASDLTNTGAVNILLKNGTLALNGDSIIKSGASEGYTGEKTWNVTLENVIFDLGAYTPGGNTTLFALSDGAENGNSVNLKINGGEIRSDIDVLKSIDVYSADANDSVLFGRYNGEYTRLVTHTTEFNYSHYAEALPTASGDKYFVEVSDNGTASVYELRSLTIVSGNKEFTIELGSNVKYLSAIDYPFAVFDNTGEFYGAFDYFLGKNDKTSAIGAAITKITSEKNDPNGDGNIIPNPFDAYVLMRTDYTTRKLTNGTHEYYKLYTYARGNVIIDMQGYTITQHPERASSVENGHIFDCEIRGTSYSTRMTVKNGSFKVYGSSVIRFISADYKSDKKDISWTFDNVSFGLAEGTDTAQRFFHFTNAASSVTTVASVTLNLNDCIYDIYTVPTNTSQFAIFGQALWKEAYLKANINVNGGKILARKLDKFLMFGEELSNAVGLGPTLRVGVGKDGEYLKLVIPKSESTSAAFKNFEAITVLTDDGKSLGFGLSETDSVNNTYSLYAPTVTDYGTIPSKYGSTEIYPFAVFKNGSFYSAYSDWATDSGNSALSESKAAGSVVLLRRDYLYNQSNNYHNLSQTESNTVIDLGGFTFTSTDKYMFNAQKKTNFNTKITVKNGTVIVGRTALMSIDTDFPDLYSGGYGFTFIFDKINFKITANSATGHVMTWNTFSSGDKDEFLNLTFNGCVFDLSAATKNLVLFDLSDARSKNTVVINGGKIVTSGYELTIADIDGGHAETTLTFAKNTNGEYTNLVIPTGTVLPVQSVNGGELCYIKTAENDGYTVYKLVSAEVTEFVPKSSITLGSELVYNVYVPAIDYLKSFTVDGVAYEKLEPVTLEDGEQYYRISVSLPAATAARDIVLKATVTVDGKDYSGAWTMSVPKYARKLIEAGKSEQEVTLVKDVLAYIKAAYIYFDRADKAEAIATINEILGSYSSEFSRTEGVTNTENGLWGVVIVLDANPYIRFVLPEGVTAETYTFKSGNTTLSFKTGTMTVLEKTYNYAEVSLYAYQLIEEITYSDGVNSGSYHLNSYYDFVTTDDGYKNDVNLITLVEKLYNYCKSAEAYRTSVANG